MFPTKILLATDGSTEAARAARMATKLSESLDSELHVAYVEPVQQIYGVPEATFHDPEFWDDVRSRAEEESRQKLDEQVEEIEKSGVEVAGTHAGVGRADAIVVRLAEEIGVGLVVVGSRGHGPIKRVLMGSVSTGVVHHAHGSVLVVRSDERSEDYLPGRILLAIDGSGEAQSAARAAVEISNATGSELHILFTLQTAPQPPYPHPLAGERWGDSLERAKHDAREFLDRQAKRLEEEGSRVKDAHLAFGKADEEIVKARRRAGSGSHRNGQPGPRWDQ